MLDLTNLIRKSGAADLNLVESPFAEHIYRDFCDSKNERLGVTADSAKIAMRRVDAISNVFRTVAGSDDGVAAGEPFAKLVFEVLHEVVGKEVDESVSSLMQHWEDQNSSMEAFHRWDANMDGKIDETECVAMGLMLITLREVYLSILTTGQGPKGLTREQYGAALVKLGFADVTRVFSGIFLDSVFSRLDTGGDGYISLPEFWQGVGRLMRPITWSHKLHATPGWPGHSAFGQGGDPQELANFLGTLETGDVILMRMDDAMGRFLQYALDSPYNHLAVVVRHAARPGVANERTERFLQKYAFRRKSHIFCSPGYCRCFSSSWEAGFEPSVLSCLSGRGVSLLESTGEGIHVYDLAHRLFESYYAGLHSVVAVRRLRGVANQGDTPRVETFIQKVRGKLYTTKPEELKAAVGHTAKQDTDKESYFCSKIVAAFYKHMGWLPEDSIVDYMPCDWDDDPSPLASPVQLSQGSLGPVEILHSDFIPGVMRPWKAPRKK